MTKPSGRQAFILLYFGVDYTYGRSVVVITERCQRLNPGSNPGVRIFTPFWS